MWNSKRVARNCIVGVILFASFVAPLAHAVLIDFDDVAARPSEPFDGCYCGHTLSNEYESLGVLIDGWLIGNQLPDGTNQNYVVGFNTIVLDFVNEAPVFVSFNANSAFGEEVVHVEVFGKDGFLFSQNGSGWRGSEEESTPYIPNELITIQAAEGIHKIFITSFYNNRLGASIDNLTFEYSAVPAPSSIGLIALGFIGLLWQRRRLNSRTTPIY